MEFSAKAVDHTREINENIYIDLDSSGGLVNMTIEHAKLAANISEMSFQQMEAAGKQ